MVAPAGHGVGVTALSSNPPSSVRRGSSCAAGGLVDCGGVRAAPAFDLVGDIAEVAVDLVRPRATAPECGSSKIAGGLRRRESGSSRLRCAGGSHRGRSLSPGMPRPPPDAVAPPSHLLVWKGPEAGGIRHTLPGKIEATPHTRPGPSVSGPVGRTAVPASLPACIDDPVAGGSIGRSRWWPRTDLVR